MLSIFSYASWPSVCLLWRNVCSGLPLILALGCLSFWSWTDEPFVFLEVNPITVVWFANIFSYSKGVFSSYLWFPFSGGSDVKASACSVGDLGSILGSGRFPGEGNGNPLQYSCLENPMDGGAWWATVHGVAKNRTQPNDFTLTNFYLQKFLSLIRFYSFILLLSSLGGRSKKILLWFMAKGALPVFSSKSFIITGHTFQVFDPLYLRVGVRRCSAFILSHVAVQFSQHRSLKRLSFLHCIFLPPLSQTATAKSLQSCPTLCDPRDSSLPGSSVPGILQARTLD